MTSLRGRLLTSYIAIILLTLLVVAVGLAGFATLSSVRFVPVLQRLAAISLSDQNDLVRLWQAGASPEDLQAFLQETADLTDVRIVITDQSDNQIVFDTETTDTWQGDLLGNVSRPGNLAVSNVPRTSIFGRLEHPDGTQWLVYADPNPVFGRALIFYAQPEPSARSFFNEFFLRPLIFAGLFAFLMAILLAVLITRSVASPLQDVAGAAGAIAQGDYKQRVPLKGPDEVRHVAASFNTMADRVQSTQEAQRDFLANVSHDLKTPLTVISGWSQALMDGAAESVEERVRAAETINDEAHRMARMVNDLLDLARIESGQLQLARRLMDLGEVVGDVHRNMQPRAREKEIDLVLDRAPAPLVYGDPDRLLQVVSNLVDNALTYTPAGGRVKLSVRTNQEWVEAAVADTGPGIPPDQQERIFERFYRVEKARTRGPGSRGSGLGLAIVRELVEAHDGQVRIESALGEGTTFTVQLPAVLTLEEGFGRGVAQSAG